MFYKKNDFLNDLIYNSFNFVIVSREDFDNGIHFTSMSFQLPMSGRKQILELVLSSLFTVLATIVRF